MTRKRSMNLDKARKIRIMYFKDRIKQIRIAEIMNISQPTVSRVISDTAWTEPYAKA